MKTTLKERREVLGRLAQLGIEFDDACKLRRIAMTLHRWHELECGDGNDYGSWAIERDDNGDGPPFMVHHHYRHGKGPDTITRTRVPDREAGALNRLAKIMADYPKLAHYVQRDPRGASLYVLRKDDLNGHDIEQVYTCGVAIY